MKNSGARVTMVVHSDYLHDHRVRREAAALASEGYSVTVLAFWPEIETPENIKGDGADIYRFPLKHKAGKLRYIEFIRRVRKELRLHMVSDIIHAHDLDALIAAAPLAVSSGAKLIYDSHELHTALHSLENRLFTRSVWKFLENRYIHSASLVITVSEGIASELQKMYHLQEKPTVVRNFTITPSAADSENESTVLEQFPLKTRYKAVYQGMLQAGRGLELMIDAISELPGWGLYICGDGPMRKQLEQLALRSGSDDRICFTGMLERNDLFKLSSGCDAGLLLTEPAGKSHLYSLPNKLTEYVHAGLPVLATGLPEIKSIVEGYRIGLCLNPEELNRKVVAGKIEEIGKKSRLFRQALRDAVSELSWETEQQWLLKAYRLLLSGAE